MYPVPVWAAIGTNISLDCRTYNLVNITWLINFQPFNESARRFVLRNGTLVVLNVDENDTAAYTCQASTRAGINQVTVAVDVGNLTTSKPAPHLLA